MKGPTKTKYAAISIDLKSIILAIFIFFPSSRSHGEHSPTRKMILPSSPLLLLFLLPETLRMAKQSRPFSLKRSSEQQRPTVWAPQKKFEKGCQLLTLSLLLTSSTLVTVLLSPTAIWRSTMIPPFRTNLSSSQRKTLPCRGLGPHY